MNRQILLKTIFIWGCLSVIPIIYNVHTTQQSHRFLIERLEAEGNQFLNYVDEKAALLHDQLGEVYTALSHSSLLLDFAITQNPRYKTYLQNQLQITAKNIKYFSQFRYVTPDGKESIRIDFPEASEHPTIVQEAQLTDLSKRNYFQYAKRLAPGEQGYFGLALDDKYDQPITPYQPKFRLIYPLDDQQQRVGYFIANIAVFKTITYITSNPQHYTVDFIDNQGYYLLSSNKEKLFGGLIQDRQSFNLPQEKPKLWHAIRKTPKQTGFFLSQEGLYVFQPFYTTLFETKNRLTLITLIPTSRINQIFQERGTAILHTTLQLLALMGIIAVMLTWMWHNYNHIKIEKAFSKVVLDNSTPVALTDSLHNIVRANTQFCKLVNVDEKDIRQYNVLDIYRPKNMTKKAIQSLQSHHRWHGEIALNNNTYKIEIRSLMGTNHKVRHYVYSLSDISEQYNAMVEFKHQSEKDPATGLNNKKRFDETLLHYAKLKHRYSEIPESCLVLADIDNFKRVNDTYGHAIGDEVIQKIAKTFEKKLRTTDFIARIGGDEFAIILQHINIEQAYTLMQKICADIEHANYYQTTISVGIVKITENAKNSFNQADKALYRSKRKGKNCVSANGFDTLTIEADHHQIL